jgi:single-stranded-DNA-specific exonuclease
VIEQAAILEADAQAMHHLSLDAETPVLVLANSGWHPGVLGLISSRLKEKYNRPVFAVSLDPDGGGHGSGRSITGVDLGTAVRKAVDEGVLASGGGHAMAAGVSLKANGLVSFTAFMRNAIQASVREARLYAGQAIDVVSTAKGLSALMFEDLERAGPYGSHMPEPIFALANQLVEDVRVVGQNHVRLRLKGDDGGSTNAISFRASETTFGQALLAHGGKRMHVAGTLSLDQWSGTPRVQMRLVDVALV